MVKGVHDYWKGDLIKDGWEIDNSQITNVSLTMADNGCLTLWLSLSGEASCCYGGRCLGHGYLGATEFQGSAKAIEYIMILMDIVGVERFEDLEGKYIRIASHGLGSEPELIGNITKSKWFNQKEFFAND